jgi:DNA replication licensing factor MCM3
MNIIMSILYRLLDNPVNCLPALEQAMKEFVALVNSNYVKNIMKDLHVGLEGNFGNYYVNPRILSSKYLAKLICIDGIVTKCK